MCRIVFDEAGSLRARHQAVHPHVIPSRLLRSLHVICPTGKSVIYLSSPSAKNISLLRRPKSLLELRHPVPERGAYHDRHGRWVRDAVDAAASGARIARGRMMLMRTAKSCGPDAPTLASSFAGFVPRDDGGKKARSPGRARSKPLKPLRREGRVFRWTCGDYTRVLPTHCTRGCGCSGHPAFPAPSVCEGGSCNNSGISCRGIAGLCLRLESHHCEARKRRSDLPGPNTKAGYPVRSGLSAPTPASGILGHPLSRMTTIEDGGRQLGQRS